jgi:hypothetical protein
MTLGSGEEDDWAKATEAAATKNDIATKDDDRIRFTGDLLGSIRKRTPERRCNGTVTTAPARWDGTLVR